MNGKTLAYGLALVLGIFLLACLQAKADECRPLEVGRVIDSDTFVSTTGERIRVVGLDGPEIGKRAACPREAMLGEIATTEARRLLGSASNVTYCPTGRESWGRTVAAVYVDGRSLADSLIGDRWAVRWNGTKHNYCEVP